MRKRCRRAVRAGQVIDGTEAMHAHTVGACNDIGAWTIAAIPALVPAVVVGAGHADVDGSAGCEHRVIHRLVATTAT